MSISIAHNIDCEKFMAGCKDKEFDLACVDPPYGICDEKKVTGFMKENFLASGRADKWDKIPSKKYFEELKRISKNQIICGGNYFLDFLGKCVAPIIWDKQTPDNFFADGEFLWTSFNKGTLRIFRYGYSGFTCKHKLGRNKCHPNEKPVALYKWLFHNYAKPGWKILDTHLGSGSSRVAAHEMGLDFYACELDTDYFNDQEKRFAEYLKYRELNTPDFLPEIKQDIQDAAFKEVDLL